MEKCFHYQAGPSDHSRLLLAGTARLGGTFWDIAQVCILTMVFLYFTYYIIKFHICLLSRKVKDVTDIKNCVFTSGQRIPRTEGDKDSLCQCPIACRWVLMEEKK